MSFHRNIPGFILQGGDIDGRGGHSIWERPFDDELHEELRFSKRGIVAMAIAAPNQNGSQFFITYGENRSLDDTCTVFGQLIGGLAVLDAIESSPCGADDAPLRPVRVERVTIHANPFAAGDIYLRPGAPQ